MLAEGGDRERNERLVGGTSIFTVDDVLRATSEAYGVVVEEYQGFRSGAGGRNLSAYLCRRYSTATLAELSERFGLKHPDSSSDMVKRAKRPVNENHVIAQRMKRIHKKLGVKPETRACPHAKHSPDVLPESKIASVGRIGITCHEPPGLTVLAGSHRAGLRIM